MLEYAKEENLCRNQILLSYFNETNSKPCGKCDVCLRKMEKELTNEEFLKIKNGVESLLSSNECSVGKLVEALPFREEKIVKVLRYLLDNQHIIYDEVMKLKWVKK